MFLELVRKRSQVASYKVISIHLPNLLKKKLKEVDLLV